MSPHGHDHGSHEHGPHEHGHGHSHGHDHAPANFDRAFAVGTALNLLIVIAQLGFGYLAHSLALMADAAHNFTDVVGLLMAWIAAWLARRQPTQRYTYGYRRASILAALGNAGLLLIATGGIIVEALQRFSAPQPIATMIVIWVAAAGIVVNGATALMFMRGRHDDLNVRAAFLHMAGDAGISLGVVASAIAIAWTGWLWIDPAMSLGIALAVIWSGWGLARDATHLALDAVPAHIDCDAVETYLRSLPGITEIHDMHIWAMSTTETALTVHLVRPDASMDDEFLREVTHHLEHHFRIGHATLQLELGTASHACPLAV